MSARTEQPTPRRLREARRRGEVATSRELAGAAALLAGLGALAATGPATARALAEGLRTGLALAVGPGLAPAPALRAALALLLRSALPTCGAALLGAAVAGALQTRGLVAPAALRFSLARLDPVRGLRRLVSAERLVQLALGAVKVGLTLGLALRLLAGAGTAAAGAPWLGAAHLLRLLPALTLRLALPLATLLAALGALDLLLAQRRHWRGLMMTREEVLRERRDEEGDPRLAGERRRLHRALAALPVRRATCVVVNPTRLAVALHHPRGTEDAPVVLAKGAGQAAAHLRAEARRAGVPVVRDVALARALFRLGEVGEEIPEELYQAAAAVLVHVHQLAQEAAP